MRARVVEESSNELTDIATFALPRNFDSRKRKAEQIHDVEAARRLLQQRTANTIAAASAASSLKLHDAEEFSSTVHTACEDSETNTASEQRPDPQGEDKVHMAALRTRLTQVMGDLNSERQENRRLVDENKNLRSEAEKSRTERFDLKNQVESLSAVVRELWSHQGSSLHNMPFISDDAMQTFARVVGPPRESTRDDHSDVESEKFVEDHGQSVHGQEQHGSIDASALNLQNESIDNYSEK